jgi:hypothetical protein
MELSNASQSFRLLWKTTKALLICLQELHCQKLSLREVEEMTDVDAIANLKGVIQHYG